MNDPNGLIRFGGAYHLFYQHFPGGVEWGPMHWGHARSADLLEWEHLPIALRPDKPYDTSVRGGCFSGSGVEDGGTLALLYTGHVERDNAVIESQCLATSADGQTFVKYPENPVIAGPPPGGGHDFRDPKVWRHAGRWYMAVGSTREGRGCVYLYESGDLRRWRYKSILLHGSADQGWMWECPDLFPVGDRHALVVSAIRKDDGPVFYMTGRMDYAAGTFTPHLCREVDGGPHFYAPQTFDDGQGRRIMVGWMDSWRLPSTPTKRFGWCGAMTIPRTVDLLSDGTLSFKPVRELKERRKGRRRTAPVNLVGNAEELLVPYLPGRCMEADAGFIVQRSGRCGVRLVYGGPHRVELAIDPVRREVEALVAACGFDGPLRRTAPLSQDMQGTVNLHLIVDASCIEVFADQGRSVMSMRAFPPDPADCRIEAFSSDGADVLVQADVWELG